MKKTHLAAVVLFVTAAVVGSLAVGSGVFAQSVTSSVSCAPASYSVNAGQSLTLTAAGGDGSYVWSSPGLVVTNPTGSTFAVAFNTSGTYPVTVTSGGTTATCSVVVTGVATIPPPTTVPGLPNTGELPE